MLWRIFILVLIQYLCIFERCDGHGYLADPPARSSAWLFDSDFASCCSYYDHAQMFCGGVYNQWMRQSKDMFTESIEVFLDQSMISRRKMFDMW